LLLTIFDVMMSHFDMKITR